MPLWTVSLGSLLSTSLSTGSPALRVHLMRHRFQMVRVTAGCIAAEMVEFQSVRDRTDQCLPDVPVNIVKAVVEVDAPISERGAVAGPFPTVTRSVDHVDDGRHVAVYAARSVQIVESRHRVSS